MINLQIIDIVFYLGNLLCFIGFIYHLLGAIGEANPTIKIDNFHVKQVIGVRLVIVGTLIMIIPLCIGGKF